MVLDSEIPQRGMTELRFVYTNRPLILPKSKRTLTMEILIAPLFT